MESPAHFKGKARLEKILLEAGWIIYYHDGDISFNVTTSIGHRTYWPDVLASKDNAHFVAFEVDGKKGHSTKRDFNKMNIRDSSFEAIDIKTVRISTGDLVGKKKQQDSLIREEIAWQLS